MLTVDGTVGWYNSSELCWTALLDRHTWPIVRYICVMVGRVASLILTVNGTFGWYNSSELCWTALLDRHTWPIVKYSCVMVGRVASLMPVADFEWSQVLSPLLDVDNFILASNHFPFL